MKKFLPILFFILITFFTPLFWREAGGEVFAQEKNTKLDSLKSVIPQKISTVIKTGPFAMLFGNLPLPIFTSEYRFLYETTTARLQTMQIGLSYFGKGPIIWYIEKDTLKKNPNASIQKIYITGFRAQASYRFFWNKWMDFIELVDEPVYAPVGLYFSPHISFSTVKLTYKALNQYDWYIRANAFSISLLSGFQGIFYEKYTLDIYAGLGYKQIEWFEHNQKNVRAINLKTDPDFKDYAKAIPNYLEPVKYTFGINIGYCF